MKKVRRISKQYYVRQIMACWMILSMGVVIPVRIAIADPLPGALPQGWELVTGGSDIPDYTTTADTMYIRNIVNGTIFKWDGGFNIGDLATADFQFAVAGSSVMNKDLTGSMSEIYGDLIANGNVWIINPAGIVIGPDATFDVTQLVASSLKIDDADFINGMPYTFTDGLTAGDVVNNADIEAEVITLIGKNVMNGGALVADDLVIMAAGDTVRISDGTPISVEVDMGAGVPGDFVLTNEGGNGIDAKSIVLAAGDIFSAAYISAHDEATSDAVATVIVDAEGDVTITGDISAHTYVSTLDPDDNAISTIDIDAGGSVDVDAQVKSYAEAYHDSGNATATVDITADENVNINSSGESEYAVEAEAKARLGSKDATASVDFHAGGNVNISDNVLAMAIVKNYSGNATATTKVVADNITVTDDGGLQAVSTSELGSGDAEAFVDIDTDGDVLVDDNSKIVADAIVNQYYTSDATADVDIKAGGDVTVQYGSEIHANAYANSPAYYDGPDKRPGPDPEEFGGGNVKATVNIEADNVFVGYSSIIGGDKNGDLPSEPSAIHARAVTETGDGYFVYIPDGEEKPETLTQNATAEVTILADGEVKVEENTADSEDRGTGGIFTDADVIIHYGVVDKRIVENGGQEHPLVLPGDASATTTIDARDDVIVRGTSGREGYHPGYIGANARIEFDQENGGVPISIEGKTSDAFATVDVESCANVIVDGSIDSLAVINSGNGDKILPPPVEVVYGNTTANTIVKAFEDVIVNQEGEPEPYFTDGHIGASASNGTENSANVTVLAVSDVIVNDGISVPTKQNGFGNPEILADASNGSTNNASVHIATRDGIGEGDVIVNGQIVSNASGFVDGSANTANVQISAARDVTVGGGYAEIGFPEGPVVFRIEQGGLIEAYANGGNESTNNANVEIYADRDVTVNAAEIEVIDPCDQFTKQLNGFGAGGQIIAMTGWSGNNSVNTSNVDISAQRDVTINGSDVEFPVPLKANGFGDLFPGQVLAGAHGNESINTTSIQITAQDDVTIDGQVSAQSGTGMGAKSEHYADIVIAAGDQLTGSGDIEANADPAAAVAEASVTFFVTALGKAVFDGEAYSTIDRRVTKVDPEVGVGPVDAPEDEFDWIDWTWCEDCEDVPAPVAPLAQFQLPTIEGCPVEMQAVAVELGIEQSIVQVSIGNALALNPTLQPCQACATLINTAGILRDEEGSRMAALNQVFNELAPADAPFTPEMATSIAMAIEGAAEDTQYASVTEFIDALVRYVAVLETELGQPVDDSVAFVMEKYGSGITDSDNANVAAYVAMRLEAIGG